MELHYLVELDAGFMFKRHIDHDQLRKSVSEQKNVTFQFYLQNEGHFNPLQKMNI